MQINILVVIAAAAAAIGLTSGKENSPVVFKKNDHRAAGATAEQLSPASDQLEEQQQELSNTASQPSSQLLRTHVSEADQQNAVAISPNGMPSTQQTKAPLEENVKPLQQNPKSLQPEKMLSDLEEPPEGTNEEEAVGEAVAKALSVDVSGAKMRTVLTVDAYPNPFTSFRECQQSGPSWLCDPQELLSPLARVEVERKLDSIRKGSQRHCPIGLVPCSVAVALIDRVPEDTTGDAMADDLVKSWKGHLSHGDCNDGAVILISRDSDRPFVGWNEGESFTPATVDQLTSLAHSELAKKKPRYEKIAIELAALIAMVQEEKVPGNWRETDLLILVPVGSLVLLASATAVSSSISKKDSRSAREEEEEEEEERRGLIDQRHGSPP